MTDDPKLNSVRIRKRVGCHARDERIVADPVAKPRRKREPNSGSMKKGETRNPNGRPKGAKGTKAIARKVLMQKVQIRDGGKTRTVTRIEAHLLKESKLAFEGDWRARRTVIDIGREVLSEEHPLAAKSASGEPDKTDEAILAWFESELMARNKEQSDE